MRRACGVSPGRRERTQLSQHYVAGWPLISLSSPAFPLLWADRVSQGALPGVLFPLRCLLKETQNISPGLTWYLSDTFTHSIHSICSSSHPLFSLSFSHEQLWGISHVPCSWEFSGTVLHNQGCLSTPERDENTISVQRFLLCH